MDESDFKGGLVGDFNRSPLQTPNKGQFLTPAEDEPRSFLCKSPSNSSFGFENTFRVLERQVSGSTLTDTDDEEVRSVLRNQKPPTTLELELGAVARLQQSSNCYYSTPNAVTTKTTTIRPAKSTTDDSDKYLEFLNQFVKKSRQKERRSNDNDKPCDKKSDGVVAAEPGLVEFGEYPELVYCISRDSRTGRYRLQNKDRIKSPIKPDSLSIQVELATLSASDEGKERFVGESFDVSGV